MDSRLYWIWLQQALGYGSRLAEPLLARFGSPEALYTADSKAFREFRLPSAVQRRLEDKSMDRPRGILWRMVSEGDWMLTPADEAYPALLRGIFDFPLVLYGRGVLPACNMLPVIAVIATRHITVYGERVTRAIAADLARSGVIVVNGGALGGEAIVASAALDAGGAVVTVQVCGLDVCYPAANESLRQRTLQNEGTLLTEYPYGVRYQKGAFHVRNRLLSGLSMGVCVTEAPLGSGTLITAKHAREQGRDVFAVPGDITSPASGGVNRLIQEGAKLVSSAREILEEYRQRYPHILEVEVSPPAPPLRVAQTEQVLPPPPQPPQELSEVAAAVLAAMDDTPRPVDEIAATAGLPMGQVFAALTELELGGQAVSSAGQQYRRQG